MSVGAPACQVEHVFVDWGATSKTAPDGLHRPTPATPDCAGVSVMESSMPDPGDVTREPR